MARLERNTYTNLSQTAAASLVRLIQEERPLEIHQTLDADSGRYVVSVIHDIDARDLVTGR